MREITAGRTLVKSPPELWAVCSDADSLAQHLEAFGEIRITRLEPETTVAWEGERASGTVRIEPSGWGTKVTVTAATAEPAAAEPGAAEPAATEPEAQEPTVAEPTALEATVAGPETEEPQVEEPAPVPARRPGFFARLFGSGARASVPPPVAPEQASAAPEPVAVPEPRPERKPVEEDLSPVDAAAALEAALDSLGQAHRRPFSR
jgi:hypothetical protein